MKDLTIVIPSLGRDSLFEALDSIVEPDLSLEIIVVVDRVENLAQLRRRLAPYGALAISGPGRGAPGARNVGLKRATSKFVAFLDDDDLWSPGKAIMQIRALEADGVTTETFSVVGVSFVGRSERDGRRLARRFDSRKESLGNYLVGREKFLYRGGYFCSSAILGPTEWMQQTLWNEVQNDHDDWDYVIRLHRNAEREVVVIPQALVTLRQGSTGSLSESRNWDKSLSFLQRFPEEISGRSKSDFALIHVVLPAIQTKAWAGVIEGLRSMKGGLPRFGAVARFLAGLATGR